MKIEEQNSDNPQKPQLNIPAVSSSLFVGCEVKLNKMKELKIYEFQAKQIEDTFRLVARTLESKSKTTSLDRDVMQSWKMIKNVLAEKIDVHVPRM